MASVMARLDRILLVALLGSAGGAVNAWLCFARIPVPVHDNPDFGWVVVPGGALHGAMLAVVPLLAAVGVARWRLGWRVATAPVVGWVAGCVSWIPLHHWVFDKGWAKSLLWFWQGETWSAVAWLPFAYFGVVGAMWYLTLTVGALGRSWLRLAALAACAGAVGALWFWIEFGPWYFAAIHGTIWGALVGLGASKIGLSREGDVA